MDIQEYRRQIEAALEREAALEGVEAMDAGGDPAEILRDAAASEAQRVAAVQPVADAARENAALIELLLGVLQDASVPAAVRRAVLASLRQLRFNSMLLNRMRAQFIEALRAVVDDPDQELREEVLETLAQEKDEYAQRRLLAGLRGEEPPLVSQEKAIQLLGYDIHAEHYPILRQVVESGETPAARREAVRLLSADPTAVDLLVRVFQDKNEHQEVRRASASALATLAPQEFEGRAKDVALDSGDSASVRATSITGLEHFGNPTALAEDESFLEGLNTLEAGGVGAESAGGDDESLEKAISSFKGRFRREK
jgi:uncharacterized protein (UPF0147 family)